MIRSSVDGLCRNPLPLEDEVEVFAVWRSYFIWYLLKLAWVDANDGTGYCGLAIV